jgi:hypothetical protein
MDGLRALRRLSPAVGISLQIPCAATGHNGPTAPQQKSALGGVESSRRREAHSARRLTHLGGALSFPPRANYRDIVVERQSEEDVPRRVTEFLTWHALSRDGIATWPTTAPPIRKRAP